MTVDRISATPVHEASRTSDILLDGLFTGMLGALVVALWFLALDLAAGQPFRTPALLGSVLLHGGAVPAQLTIAPLEVAAYTAFHFVVFVAIGAAFSWLMAMSERAPIMLFVLLVLFLSLQVGFFGLNAALHAELLGRLSVWAVVVANLLAAGAMAAYQWRRHPGVLSGFERLWDDDNQ